MAIKKLETRDFKFTVNDIDEEAGMFSGHASIWDAVDSCEEKVAPGAFRKTLKDSPARHLLWSHDIREPIGIITAKEDKAGLDTKGQINLDIQRGREIRSQMRQAKDAGVPMGLSIGFETKKDEIEPGTGVRILKEIKLWEISLCLFQACPGAVIEDVKSDDIDLEPPELKPFANEHSARLREPGDFVRIRELWRKEDKGIRAIGGPLKSKPDGETVEQAIRFDKDKWTPEEAKAWLKENDYKWIDFEPASEPEKSTPAIKPATIHLIDATVAQINTYLESKRR